MSRRLRTQGTPVLVPERMPQNLARRIKAQAAQRVIREKQVEASLWKCCGDEFHTHEAIGRHVHASHGLEIDQWQERLDHERSRKQNNAVSSESLRKRRAPKVTSWNRIYIRLLSSHLIYVIGRVRSNRISVHLRPATIPGHPVLQIRSHPEPRVIRH